MHRNLRPFFTLLLLLVQPLQASASDQAEKVLIEAFVAAFNAGDHATIAQFYAANASDDFNGRRTAEESRALHDQLTSMLGRLTIQQIRKTDDSVRLLVASTARDATAEVRFRLTGNPPVIDGFSVGFPPEPGSGHHGGEEDVAEAPVQAGDIDAGPFEFLAETDGVFQSQVFAQPDGSLLLVWVKRGPDTVDLFAARLGKDNRFSDPVRINLAALNRYVGDEARPGVAIGQNGAVAVTWTAHDNDMMLAVGSDYGVAFETPVKLNLDEGHAERTMPTVAFAPDGSPHVIWLDPREAPAGHEEPSDLYHATLRDGEVVETNLTARQETSVCGCCRPFIAIHAEGKCDIAFRNVSADGYRDIWRISGQLDSLGDPVPTSPPIWKLGGCPSAGPILAGDGTLWKDASTGDWRMLWATEAHEEPDVLFEDRENLELGVPPRAISGRPHWVLVSGKPAAMIAMRDGGEWTVIRDDLPPWASSAAVRDGELIVVGNVRGRLLATSLAVDGV